LLLSIAVIGWVVAAAMPMARSAASDASASGARHAAFAAAAAPAARAARDTPTHVAFAAAAAPRGRRGLQQLTLYASTPSFAGSVSTALDGNSQVAPDGTVHLSAGVSASQSAALSNKLLQGACASLAALVGRVCTSDQTSWGHPMPCARAAPSTPRALARSPADVTQGGYKNRPKAVTAAYVSSPLSLASTLTPTIAYGVGEARGDVASGTAGGYGAAEFSYNPATGNLGASLTTGSGNALNLLNGEELLPGSSRERSSSRLTACGWLATHCRRLICRAGPSRTPCCVCRLESSQPLRPRAPSPPHRHHPSRPQCPPPDRPAYLAPSSSARRTTRRAWAPRATGSRARRSPTPSTCWTPSTLSPARRRAGGPARGPVPPRASVGPNTARRSLAKPASDRGHCSLARALFAFFFTSPLITHPCPLSRC
jgi:hypothetical protein